VFTHPANHRIEVVLNADLRLVVGCQLETMDCGSLCTTVTSIGTGKPSLLAVRCVAGLIGRNGEGYDFEKPLSGIVSLRWTRRF
jgi:hypothetical protein